MIRRHADLFQPLQPLAVEILYFAAITVLIIISIVLILLIFGFSIGFKYDYYHHHFDSSAKNTPSNCIIYDYYYFSIPFLHEKNTSLQVKNTSL